MPNPLTSLAINLGFPDRKGWRLYIYIYIYISFSSNNHLIKTTTDRTERSHQTDR
jgi:hypothetical protein